MIYSMEATLEVTYFGTTVRLWIDSKSMPQCVQSDADVKSCDAEWAPQIRQWLMDRWGGMTLVANRAPLDELFNKLESIPGIIAAQIVECLLNEDRDTKRGYLVRYVP
ncbi:MAG TPA: hypothetical protein VI504_00165 [Candidatus Eisenbacteria bacterium]|jgi:hypothetical protein